MPRMRQEKFIQAIPEGICWLIFKPNSASGCQVYGNSDYTERRCLLSRLIPGREIVGSLGRTFFKFLKYTAKLFPGKSSILILNKMLPSLQVLKIESSLRILPR